MSATTFNPAAIGMDVARDWLFAESQSKIVGTEGPLMKKLRANAPRVASGLRLAGNIPFFFEKDLLLISSATVIIISLLTQIAWGTKENQKKLVAQKGGHLTGRGTLGKILHPREYPVESGAGMSILANALFAAYGVKESVYTASITGGIVMLISAYMLLGKEKKDATKDSEENIALPFAESEHKPQGIIGRVARWVKDNPVASSSLVFIGICVGGIIGSILEQKPLFVLALSIITAGMLVQMLFVTKKGFNIEGAQEEARVPEKATFQERLAGERLGGIGLQPN